MLIKTKTILFIFGQITQSIIEDVIMLIKAKTILFIFGQNTLSIIEEKTTKNKIIQ